MGKNGGSPGAVSESDRPLPRLRRIATRYDELDGVFLPFIHLAIIYDALQPT